VFLADYRSSWLFHSIRSLLFPLSFAFVIIATSRTLNHEGAIFLLGGILTASLAFGPTSVLIVKLGWSRQNGEFEYWIMQPIPKLVLILAIVSVALLFALPGLLVTYCLGSLLQCVHITRLYSCQHLPGADQTELACCLLTE
jgi:hypothetical protein